MLNRKHKTCVRFYEYSTDQAKGRGCKTEESGFDSKLGQKPLFPKRMNQIWGSPTILLIECDYTLFFPQN